MGMAGLRAANGFREVLRLQWVSYWRRFSRGGNGSRNSLILLGLIAVAASARYASILKGVAAQAHTGQFGELDLLTAAIFVLCLSPVWDTGTGAMGPRELTRFPLTARERLIARIAGGFAAPISWLALLGCVSVFWPLGASPHPVGGLIAGAAFLCASLMAGYAIRQSMLTSLGSRLGFAALLVLIAAAALAWMRLGRGSALLLNLLPSHLVVLAAAGSWLACAVLLALAAAAVWFARASLTWMLERAPAAANRKAASSATMSLLTKDLRYFRRSEPILWLILLGLALYLATGASPEPDAVRAVLAFTSLLASGVIMNSFAVDGVAGMDRFGLWPLHGATILGTKNRAQTMLAAARWGPILALAFWRFGWHEGLGDSAEAASLLLANLAWGNVTSVRHPYTGEESPSLLDQVVGLAVSAVPGGFAIAMLRGGQDTAPFAMLGMLAFCALAYAASLRWAGNCYSREFDSMRARMSL